MILEKVSHRIFPEHEWNIEHGACEGGQAHKQTVFADIRMHYII